MQQSNIHMLPIIMCEEFRLLFDNLASEDETISLVKQKTSLTHVFFTINSNDLEFWANTFVRFHKNKIEEMVLLKS